MTRPEKHHDQQPKKDLDPALVTAFAATFIVRFDMYPLQLENGRYISLQRHLYPDLITAHLKGFITLGTYALSQDSQAKWLCLDADDDYRWNRLRDLAATLTTQGVVPYVEPSRRGGHLWLFTDPRPGSDLRRFGLQLLKDRHLDRLRIEVYPKQFQLSTGPGSFVRLPLGKHRLTGKTYPFITIDGTPLKSPEADSPSIRDQIKILTSPVKVSPDFISSVLDHAPPVKLTSPTPRFEARPQPEHAPARKKSKKRREKPVGTPSERIKTTISVADFVGQYVELDDQHRGHCPFHDDQVKSFSINTDHNFWHCFACERGGSLIDFWMVWRKRQGEDGSFKATIRDLAQRLLK